MPTGYTANIEKGISFKEYALTCARAFGALMDLRDDPLTSEIPDGLSRDNYYDKALERAEKQLKEYLGKNEEQLKEEWEKYIIDETYNINKYIQDKKELLDKYSKMLEEVDNYEPPTSDHQDFKKFMKEQITDSINWDCNTSYYEEQLEQLPSFEDWKTSHLEGLKHDLEYYKKELQKEIDRYKEKNEWIKQLKQSLK